MIEFLRDALAEPGFRGFLYGLVPGLLVALATFLREVYLDRKRAKREDDRAQRQRDHEAAVARRERTADRFLAFEAPLIRFLPLFEEWSREQDLAIWFEFRLVTNWLNEDGKVEARQARTRTLEAALSELLVVSPNSSIREAVRATREQLRTYRREYVKSQSSIAKWKLSTPDFKQEAPPKEFSLGPESELKTLAPLVDSISEAHAKGAVADYREKLRELKRDESTGAEDLTGEGDEAGPAVDLDASEPSAGGLVEEPEDVEASAAHRDLDPRTAVPLEDGLGDR